MAEEKDRMEDIEKLEERIALEKESIPMPEKTLEAASCKAKRLAAKIKASGLAKLEGGNFEKVSKIVKGIEDALEDAKCKVDCITVTGDAEETVGSLEDFTEKCDEKLGRVMEAKVKAAEELNSLAEAAVKTKRLDMAKVNAHVGRIISNVKASMDVKAEVDRKEIQQNLTNLVQKSKTNQRLMTLVDWASAGISKTTKVSELTVDDLQKLIVNMRGGKD